MFSCSVFYSKGDYDLWTGPHRGHCLIGPKASSCAEGRRPIGWRTGLSTLSARSLQRGFLGSPWRWTVVERRPDKDPHVPPVTLILWCTKPPPPPPPSPRKPPCWVKTYKTLRYVIVYCICVSFTLIPRGADGSLWLAGRAGTVATRFLRFSHFQ